MKINRLLIILFLSAIAFGNAFYLSYKAYYFKFVDTNISESFCDLAQNVSCSEVLKSPYSQVLGIPFPWIAFVVYPLLFMLAYFGYKKKNIFYAKVIQVFSFCGILFNFFIIYREMFLIFAFCLLCLICTLIIVSIFILSTLEIRSSNVH